MRKRPAIATFALGSALTVGVGVASADVCSSWGGAGEEFPQNSGEFVCVDSYCGDYSHSSSPSSDGHAATDLFYYLSDPYMYSPPWGWDGQSMQSYGSYPFGGYVCDAVQLSCGQDGWYDVVVCVPS